MAMLSLSHLNAGNFCLTAPLLNLTTHRFPFQFPISTKTPSICLPAHCFGRKNEEQKLDSKANEKEEEEFKVLVALKSTYNHIIIVDSPIRRRLLLDDTHNVNSVIFKGQKWTGSLNSLHSSVAIYELFFMDEFASLPAVIPPRPIAILGLGGGTVARLLLSLQFNLKVGSLIKLKLEEKIMDLKLRLTSFSPVHVWKLDVRQLLTGAL